jgi:hypothetical protein
VVEQLFQDQTFISNTSTRAQFGYCPGRLFTAACVITAIENPPMKDSAQQEQLVSVIEARRKLRCRSALIEGEII